MKITLEPCKVEMILDKKHMIYLHLINNDEGQNVKIAAISKTTGKIEYFAEVPV